MHCTFNLFIPAKSLSHFASILWYCMELMGVWKVSLDPLCHQLARFIIFFQSWLYWSFTYIKPWHHFLKYKYFALSSFIISDNYFSKGHFILVLQQTVVLVLVLIHTMSTVWKPTFCLEMKLTWKGSTGYGVVFFFSF